jgi:hypothetical protein
MPLTDTEIDIRGIPAIGLEARAVEEEAAGVAAPAAHDADSATRRVSREVAVMARVVETRTKQVEAERKGRNEILRTTIHMRMMIDRSQT